MSDDANAELLAYRQDLVLRINALADEYRRVIDTSPNITQQLQAQLILTGLGLAINEVIA